MPLGRAKCRHAEARAVASAGFRVAQGANLDAAGPLFAVFITAFLRADPLAEQDALKTAGFTPAEAARIAEETRESEAAAIRRQLWKAATPTVRCMEHHGLLEHAATREALEMLDLLRPGNGPANEDLPAS